MDEREQMRRWVQNWKELGPILENIRREEIVAADNVAVMAVLAGAFNDAATLPMCETSGLVEMQRSLSKLRPKT
ncbi:MAG: hypothetical protein FJW38_13190 [Acidobacteria bacterium]|nr:hypothetical protein [Acidobacteriota bacterium]